MYFSLPTPSGTIRGTHPVCAMQTRSQKVFAVRVEVRYHAVLSADVVPIEENETGSSEVCTRVLYRFEKQVLFSSYLIHTQTPTGSFFERYSRISS